MNLAEILKEKRPTLSSSSVKTYTSVLKSLHAKVFGSTTPLSLDNFQQRKYWMLSAIKLLKHVKLPCPHWLY